MQEIRFCLLQTPNILQDQNPVNLPFKKAEALLYYLAVKKTITREEAAGLFWSTCSDETARKNLRHTLYTIRKTLGEDLIVTPKKQILTLNPDLNIVSDYDRFLHDGETSLYQGEFLQGFFVKNTDEFDEWLRQERTYIREIYLRRLYLTMKELPLSQLTEAEQIFNRYIRQDSMDERVYFRMMQIYYHHHLYLKGIKIYEQLEHQLDTELQISPSKETSDLYHELLASWTEESIEQSGSSSQTVTGREQEIQQINQYYYSLLSGKPVTLMIAGDNGVGKSYLVQKFLDSISTEENLICTSLCFSQEQNFQFQAWNHVMIQIDRFIHEHDLNISQRYLNTLASVFPTFASSDPVKLAMEDVSTLFSYRTIQNSILKLLDAVGREIPIILYFDNIQYMDSYSLNLLFAVIQDRNPNLMILATHPDVAPQPLSRILSRLSRENLLHTLELKPFSKEVVARFVQERFPDQPISSQIIDRIYQETEGNAFFLENLLEQMPADPESENFTFRTRGILAGRLSLISDKARILLDILSLCQDYTTLDILESITRMETSEMLVFLDELSGNGLIHESIEDNEIRFHFTHGKMQEFVHQQLSPTKARLLHHRAAEYLLNHRERKSNYWYDNIIYHYSVCGDIPNTLKYKILRLEELSNYNFDLYPIINPWMDLEDAPFADIVSKLEALHAQLREQASHYPSPMEYWESEARILYLMAKYAISQGGYERGLSWVHELLKNNPYVQSNIHFRLQCLRQLTFHGIQTWNLTQMNDALTQCIELELEHHFDTDLAIDYRLRGLYFTMLGHYPEAEHFLEKSIESFRQSPLKAQAYGLNIAACYNYLGELHRKQKHFFKAIEYYSRAIHTCQKRGCPISPLFYLNLSRVYRQLQQPQQEQEALINACERYDETPTLVGRSIAKGYLALFLAQSENFSKAKEMIQEAQQCAHLLGSPLGQGILELTEYELISRYPKEMKEVIPRSPKELLLNAGKNLQPLPGTYEWEEYHFKISSI